MNNNTAPNLSSVYLGSCALLDSNGAFAFVGYKIIEQKKGLPELTRQSFNRAIGLQIALAAKVHLHPTDW